MKSGRKITILGGGPAGIAIAYYAKENKIKYELFEASNRVGGNCITFKYKGFLYDSGAHRLHDKDMETTRIIKEMMGNDLKLIQVPSQIYREGKFIDFPLSPLNLLGFLGIRRFLYSAYQILASKIRTKTNIDNFRDLAIHTYGKNISDLFLLHYTEKLWGKPASELSIDVAGKRLKGLNLKTFILETFRGKNDKTQHLDGSFYYPKYGIGSIFEAFNSHCGDNFHLNQKVTAVYHSNQKITGIELNGNSINDVEDLVSSLPLGVLLKVMHPPPPKNILDLGNSILFRDIILVGLFLDVDSVNKNGSMYFPSNRYPFTRVYEPKNRSEHMAPLGKTSLMIEIPCQKNSGIWNEDEKIVIKGVIRELVDANIFNESDLFDSCIHKIKNAYPVLEKDYQTKINPIYDYLSNFHNLKLTGRNGLFAYTHIHDHMINGKRIINILKS